MTTSHLEAICASVVRVCDATGVVMIVLHRGKRAEVVAALTDEADDLPAIVKQLAEELEAGAGVPMGNHLRTIPGEAVQP